MSEKNYQAYLIRLWQEASGAWRAMLEDPHTGERKNFASVEDLLAYLRTQTLTEGTSGLNHGVTDSAA